MSDYGGPQDNQNLTPSLYRPTAIIPSARSAEIEAVTGQDVVARRKETILRFLAEGWSLRHACEQAGISTVACRYHREQDPEFDANMIEALEMGTDALEDVALKRARFGVDKPVFYQGEEVGHVREYSDTLLIFLLKARRPQKYSERVRNTLENPDGSAVEFTFNVGGAAGEKVAEARNREADTLEAKDVTPPADQFKLP